MVKITALEIENKSIWEDFMAAHPESDFLHSWYWGEFYKSLGRTIFRRGFYAGNQLIGISLAIEEPARRGKYLTVPGGPILDWSNNGLILSWVEDLKSISNKNSCVFVRVRPDLHDSDDNRRLFKSLGFLRAPMHLHAELTSQLDLSKSDQEIKKNMRKGTRYELNRADKLGINVEAVDDDRYIDEFYDLQLKTAQRQKFVPYAHKFLSEQFRIFSESDHALMYRSTYQNKLLAMAFIIFYGSEAAYHYGASTDLARKYPGAYAIQWQAIAEARRRGCKRYNFWGVTEHGQTNHRFYGVSVFKRGFGGEDVAYLHAHDLPINRSRYLANYLFETTRRKVRRL